MATRSDPTEDGPSDEGVGPRARGVLIAACAANGFVFLDQTASPVTLDALRRDLGSTGSEAHFVIGIYLVVLAAMMPAAARLADRFGRRPLFLFGAALFGTASVACALAPSIEVLLALRAIQGVGAALSVPLSLAVVTSALPSARRGWAVGALAAGGSVFLLVGPVLGGLLVDHAHWRWVFVLPVPLVAAALVMGRTWITDARSPQPPQIDLPGLVLLMLGLAALVQGLLELGYRGLSSGPLALALAGLAALAAFLLVEQRRDDPLIQLRLLRIPAAAGCLLTLFALQFAILALTVEVVLYLQQSLDYGALLAGALLLPTVLGSPLLSVLAGRVADRRGPTLPILTGLGLVTVSLIMVAVFAGRGQIPAMVAALLLFGLARPFVLTPATATAMRAVPAGEHHQISAMTTEARQLGGVLGVAVAGFIVSTVNSAGTSSAGNVEGFQAAILAAAGLCALAWGIGAVLIRRPAESLAADS
ncbi:MFS transporter [Tomitella biformata]|uniref:MFS transporter n=1 Tax=Tomitella biformata TaxID=630403 RepID=UPI0004666673|nr:MFS transporter [Tomitella biformata]